MAAVIACASLAAVQAEDALPARRPAGALYSAVAQYGAPLRTSAGLMIFIPTVVQGGFRSSGFLADGLVGQSGGRVSFGLVTAVEYFAVDVRGVVTRTWASPRGVSTDATYAGAEAGASIGYVHISGGLLHRVAGSPGRRATAGSWSIGLQVPLGRR